MAINGRICYFNYNYKRVVKIFMLKRIFCFVISLILMLSCCMPVFAYEPTGIDITAKAAKLICLDTDEALYDKNANERVYPAAVTNIMTAILILESPDYNPEAKLAMNKEALRLVSGTGVAVSLLKEGEEMTMLDLVYMVTMCSFGDCAYLAALHFAGSVENFVDMMNAKAAELSMSGTHYQNPIGLHHDEHYTTANDIATLTKYALQNETFKTACETSRYTLSFTPSYRGRTLSTTVLIQDNTTSHYYTYARGVKTGYTDEAGRCLVSTASHNGYNYLCILMGCPAEAGKRYEFAECSNLFRWAFNNFEFKQVADSENPVCEMPVELSADTDFVPLYIEGGFVSVLPKEADESTIVISPTLNGESVDAPVKKGDILGTADIIYAEKVIGKVNLVAGENVEKSELFALVRQAKRFFTSTAMKLVYIALAAAVVIFIIAVIIMNTGHKSRKRKVKYIPYDKHLKGDDYDE